MGENVSRIRDVFYNDLINEYQNYQQRSFLYQYFLAESVRELQKKLEKSLEEEQAWPVIGSRIWPEDASGIRKHLRDVMKKHEGWARGLLLRDPPGKKDKRERRDFWEELWLNDAGYGAGLITDREYYLWLVEYLAARDIYYKDPGVGKNLKDAHAWLYDLIYEGLRGTENALTREELVRREPMKIINIRTKSQVESDLKKLAELMRGERDESKAGSAEVKSVDRLHHLKKQTAKGKNIGYLLWLTGRLERMAIHIKIKTWLQDSGYPFKVTGKEGKTAKEPRKQDFSMRIFETYFDSHYEFTRKGWGGEDWHMEGEFCVADRNLAETLLAAVRESGNDTFYVPLAVHIFTGCVFFLAGKENYREMYEKMDERKPEDKRRKDAYEKAESCGFDYLRMDEDRLDGCPWDVGGALKMGPFYHKNAGKKYDDVLMEFKLYCLSGDIDSPMEAVRIWNGEKPEEIPDAFHWAFDGEENPERTQSPELAAEFNEKRKNAGKVRPF